MSNPVVMPPVAREDLPGLLQRLGISPTQQRLEIAALMLERTQHLSADQVIAGLAARDTAVSKATVYNTLGLFAERGLVREVMVDGTRVFYDSNTTAHHHFYNVDDGELIDIAAGEAMINELPEPPHGTSTERVELVIRVRNDAR